MARLAAGFLLAPLVAFPVALGCFGLLWFSQTAGDAIALKISELAYIGAYIGMYATIVAYGFMALVGLPVTLLLRKLRLFRPDLMASAGALAGVLPFAPALFSSLRAVIRNGSLIGHGALASALAFVLAGGLTGAAAALLVWRCGRHPPATLDIR